MFDLQWDPQIGLGDVLTSLGLLFTIVSLLFAARELRRNTLVQRAQFLLDFTERYFSDSDVRKFYYRIDYNEFELDFDTFIGSDEERWLDSLIYTFDTVGRMVKMGVVTLDEAGIIAFQASRVLRNPEVERYLSWLDEEYTREGRQTPAHADARFLVQSLLEHKAS